MTKRISERLAALPPYLFAELDRRRDEAAARGMDIIDLGVGDPDLPTPPHVVEAMKKAAENPANHRYPSYAGMLSFRETAAKWFQGRFGVELDPHSQVVSLIGSKEGLAHLPLALVNPGDVVLVPDPAYPVYAIGTLFAGGRAVALPLREENGFLPDLDAVPAKTAKKAKLIFVNYPNNPTAACADPAFYERLVAFAKEHDIIIASDAAYSEMGFDGYRAPSFLQAPGAMDVGIEFHSLSKTYNMTGWRVGFAVGNPEIVGALGRVKTNVDSGVFGAIQEAAVSALVCDQTCVGENIRQYGQRRDAVVEGLNRMGIEITPPRATFYVWFRVPRGYSSTEFCARLLDQTGVVITPGNGFGPAGEGYARIALTVPEQRCREAVERMTQAGL